MAAPIVEQIVDNVVTTLQTITTGNGYNQTLKAVERVKSSEAATINIPMADVMVTGFNNMDEEENLVYGLTTKDLNLSIRVYTGDQTDPDDALSYLESDVEKALMADVHRNSLAQWTWITSGQRVYLNALSGEEITGALDLTVTIRFQHKTTDPYSGR